MRQQSTTRRRAETGRIGVAFVSSLTVIAGCSNASPSKVQPEAGTDTASKCTSFTPSSSESDIAAAVATTSDGDCIELAAGTYKLDNQLAFGTGNGVTFRGAGIGKTILDFSGQVTGDDGIFAQSVKNLTLESFTVQNTPGNGIKALSVTGLTFDSLEVTWTGATPSAHGAYGLYPVECTDVLIQGSEVSGGTDSGIYVGQSQQIVVRHNQVYENVSGIEIENSYFADVYDNDAHDNSAGILVFGLPGLQQEGCRSVRVYDNTIENNNTPNFAAKDDIVSIVPSGTGSFVMAAKGVEVFGNTYSGNQTGAFGILDYADTGLPVNDPKFYSYPSQVYLHDNTFTNNGTSPDLKAQFGLLLFTGLASYPGMHVPDVVYDGIVDPKAPAGPDPMQICIAAPETSCNLNLEMFDMTSPNLPQIMVCYPPTTPAAYGCSLPALPPVSFPGLNP
jgi:parallel beta-helix repeat protein